MSETKHTPGPWQIEKLEAFVDGKPRYGLIGPSGEFLGWLNKWVDDPEASKESEANARLIKLAPELLEVLRVAETLIDADIIRGDANCLTRIRNAIAKAVE